MRPSIIVKIYEKEQAIAAKKLNFRESCQQFYQKLFKPCFLRINKVHNTLNRQGSTHLLLKYFGFAICSIKCSKWSGIEVIPWSFKVVSSYPPKINKFPTIKNFW